MALRIVVGGKVTGDNLFDRAGLIDRLWDRLPQQSVELVAPRRFGKTSIMQRLVDQPRRGCRVDFIDCEAFDDPSVFVSTLFDELVIESPIARAGHEVGHGVSAISSFLGRIRHVQVGPTNVGVDLADSQSPMWSSSIKNLIAAARRRPAPTIVILDEFSMMLDNFARAKVAPTIIVNLLTWLRRVRQEQGATPVLAFVVGGSMSLEYWLRRLNATATMNDLHREEVPPFDEPTARAFVAALLASEKLECEPDVPDAILQHVEPAVPFWIQALVWALVQDPGSACRITTAHVEDSYHNRLIGNAGRHYFQPFEERLHHEDPAIVRGAQRVLTYLATAPSGRGVTRASLAAVFGRSTGVESPEDFDRIFADLESDFYIRRNPDTGECFFAHKVLRDWWLRWHPSAVAAARDEVTHDD